MQRVFDSEMDEDSGPVTRRIHYVDRARHAGAQRDIGSRGRASARLTEDDARTDVERARRRLRQALAAFRETVRHTSRDLGLATRSVVTCAARWIHAERHGRGAAGLEGER